eukprot:scaffold26094_cov100-Isochrysis_galbana.AAC.2
MALTSAGSPEAAASMSGVSPSKRSEACAGLACRRKAASDRCPLKRAHSIGLNPKASRVSMVAPAAMRARAAASWPVTAATCIGPKSLWSAASGDTPPDTIASIKSMSPCPTALWSSRQSAEASMLE